MMENWFKIRFLLLVSLSMAFGWGWRGDYGHELGAMIPGAFAAMTIALASGRGDWLNRFAVIGLFGALGWAFGGSMSYGIVLGYTRHILFSNVLYGFFCIFIIGAMWGAVGGAFLGLSISKNLKYLNSFVGPFLAILVVWGLFDFTGISRLFRHITWLASLNVDWLAAVTALTVFGVYLFVKKESKSAAFLGLLAAGWIIGFVVLTMLFGMRMTPPRSDNWAGMAGLLAILLFLMKKEENKESLLLSSYGALYGGLGFSCGALFLTIGEVNGTLINSWKLMEQFFGLIMGLGLALGTLKILRSLPEPSEENKTEYPLSVFAYSVLFLFPLWTILSRNLNDWFNTIEGLSSFVPALFGVPTWSTIYLFGIMISLTFFWFILTRGRNNHPIIPATTLGKSQLFFLVMLWFVFIGDITQKIYFYGAVSEFFQQFIFAVLVIVITVLVLSITHGEDPVREKVIQPGDTITFGRRHWILWITVPLVILLLTIIATSLHTDPLPGSHLRF